MSTSAPQSGDTSAEPSITLPPGVGVSPGRETSQTNAQGQVVQGMVFPLTLPSGSTTTVFIPYSMIENTDWVQAQFVNRVKSIMALGG